MESVYEESHYKDLYGQLIKEYKRYLYRKNLIDKTPHKRKRKIRCPICNSQNQDVNLYCENCGVRLKYSFINYL